MVEWQLRRRGIGDERVLAAMGRVPRELFLPPELREAAYADAALPIGGEQTISQPYMVALICEQLALKGGERVLDVGTGSGYQAAVLAELAAEVHTIERIPELAEGARANLAAAGYENRVHLHVGDGTRGVPSVRRSRNRCRSRGAQAPPALYDQLEPRGRAPPGGRLHQGNGSVVVRTQRASRSAHRSLPLRAVGRGPVVERVSRPEKALPSR
jgi:protein-L-isoaspartate(D-aspartate) O-methyltransferase